jgi:hypothetical protein
MTKPRFCKRCDAPALDYWTQFTIRYKCGCEEDYSNLDYQGEPTRIRITDECRDRRIARLERIVIGKSDD